MRIGLVAPLHESVPPRTYGGTERVVSYLTEALVDAGHAVTLFASGDSVTRARLIACHPRALRLDPSCVDPLPPHLAMLETVYRRGRELDVIHFHCDYLHFPSTRRERVPAITTLHGRLDIPELVPLYDEYSDQPVVSISDAQRAPLPQADWRATVYHGLPFDLHEASRRHAGYLAFVGRISPEKRVDRAIEIAQRCGMRLLIAAKIDRADREYHASIEHLLRAPGVEFLGEIDEHDKGRLLRGAAGLVFPIDWPEPFGLVMIEAMACGTPVLAFRRGSVPEVIDDGVTGFVVDDVDEAVDVVPALAALDRGRVRATFERRFTADRMAADYVRVYRAVAARGRSEAA